MGIWPLGSYVTRSSVHSLMYSQLEALGTLTVKHLSINWMFCVLFISKSDCILIHCGIAKCRTKNKDDRDL